jgi:hypothetical protein
MSSPPYVPHSLPISLSFIWSAQLNTFHMWICKQIARTDLDIKLGNPRIILTLTHDRNYWTVLYGSAMSRVSLLCSLFPGGDISIVKPTRCTVSQFFFYFGTTLYMFRTVSPSVIRSLNCIYSIRYMSYRFCGCLLAGTKYTGLLKMIVAVLTTCHTKYAWDRSM